MIERSEAPAIAAAVACPARSEWPGYLAGSRPAREASFLTIRATSIPLNRPGRTCPWRSRTERWRRMSLRNRSGNWHYRFKIAGHTWTGDTGLAATERNRNAANLKEAAAHNEVIEGRGEQLHLEIKP